MKFVLVSNNLTSVKNFRTDLLLDIASKGYEVHIFAPDLNSFSYEKEFLEEKKFIVHEIYLQRTGTNPIADIKTIYSIYRLLNEIKPQVLLGYTIKPIIYGTLAAYLANVPKRYNLISGLGFAFQAHEDSEKLGFIKKIINFLYKLALKKSTKVFFQNPDDKLLLSNMNILDELIPNVIVNGSGVNIEHFYHASLNLDKDTNNYMPSFLMVARLLKDKGINEYIQAARKIKVTYPNAIFNLVGGIDVNPAAISKKELDEWVKEGIINYWGQMSDVRPALEKSNIFVLPSYREGIPRAVLEAMSMGRPIITTDAPGCKETVIEGYNGFLVEVKSIDKLVDAMEKFIVDPNLVELMGKNSRKIVLEKYDVRKVNEHMITEMNL
ncbi:glycosyltransferase family 4 protein [Acinetobacter baumannii]|uniref:glycosyltransferase family 4 protein n=1 Tax=Acinetobacter baumannii TaxID=470 RepID=UPI003AF83C74